MLVCICCTPLNFKLDLNTTINFIFLFENTAFYWAMLANQFEPKMMMIKGTVYVFQVTLHAKMTMPDWHRYSWNIYLINNVEDFSKVLMQGKLFQSCTHFLYCSVLSLGGKVNTRRMSQLDMGSIFTKIIYEIFCHRKLLCEFLKLSKSDAFNLLGY